MVDEDWMYCIRCTIQLEPCMICNGVGPDIWYGCPGGCVACVRESELKTMSRTHGSEPW